MGIWMGKKKTYLEQLHVLTRASMGVIFDFLRPIGPSIASPDVSQISFSWSTLNFACNSPCLATLQVLYRAEIREELVFVQLALHTLDLPYAQQQQYLK